MFQDLENKSSLRREWKQHTMERAPNSIRTVALLTSYITFDKSRNLYNSLQASFCFVFSRWIVQSLPTDSLKELSQDKYSATFSSFHTQPPAHFLTRKELNLYLIKGKKNRYQTTGWTWAQLQKLLDLENSWYFSISLPFFFSNLIVFPSKRASGSEAGLYHIWPLDGSMNLPKNHS